MAVDPLVSRLREAGCVFAEAEAALLRAEACDDDQLLTWADRRVAGEPLEQIVGWAEFRGLRLAVLPGVFIPRARTGAVVEIARPDLGARDVVVDLCCGTGAIGAALAAEVQGITVHAVDIDPAATVCARMNLGPGHAVHLGDLDEALPVGLQGGVAAVVANAPYVPSHMIPFMPAESREYERHTALDGGYDGLDLQRRVAQAAHRLLRPGGIFVLETSEDQVSASGDLVADAGFRPEALVDSALDATVIRAVR